MSNGVEGVFPGLFQRGRGCRRVMYMHMGLCTAKQRHARVMCVLRKGIVPSRLVKKEVRIGTVCSSVMHYQGRITWLPVLQVVA